MVDFQFMSWRYLILSKKIELMYLLTRLVVSIVINVVNRFNPKSFVRVVYLKEN